MKTEIIAAIIGSISAILVNIIAKLFEGKKYKEEIKAENERLEKSIKSGIEKSKRELSVQYITDKRVDWIYTVREELSNYISLCYFIAEKYKISKDTEGKVPSEELCKINKSIARLKLLFNFSGNLDQNILSLIVDIQSNLNQEPSDFIALKFKTDIEMLTTESQIYLKLEWERVKLETTEHIDVTELKLNIEQKEKELRLFKNNLET